MDFRKKCASCEEAKQLDLVSYLSALGYDPVKIRSEDYWYLSPLRAEKTPSFKVNRKLNCWYDHGLGQGGNVIDFAVLYHDCTVREFLQSLNQSFPLHQPNTYSIEYQPKDDKNRIVIKRERSLTSPFLFHYLRQRRVPWRIAVRYCKEVSYEIFDRNYYAIGFKNDAGGYELRNAFFKGSSTPKSSTFFDNNATELSVFEGFFDFLSFITITQYGQPIKSNFLVLNSTAFFDKARAIMEQHEVVHLYLDRDKTGQNFTRQALSLSMKYKDKSLFYDGYKDLNDWVVNFGNSSHRADASL